MAAPSVPEASSAIDAQRSGSAVRGEWVATKRVSPNRNAKAATIPSRCSPAPILTGSSPLRFARTKSVPGWLSTSRSVPGPWARIAPDTPTATAEKIRSVRFPQRAIMTITGGGRAAPDGDATTPAESVRDDLALDDLAARLHDPCLDHLGAHHPRDDGREGAHRVPRDGLAAHAVHRRPDRAADQRDELGQVDDALLARLRDQPVADPLVELGEHAAGQPLQRRGRGPLADLDARVTQHRRAGTAQQRHEDAAADLVGLDVVPAEMGDAGAHARRDDVHAGHGRRHRD